MGRRKFVFFAHSRACVRHASMRRSQIASWLRSHVARGGFGTALSYDARTSRASRRGIYIFESAWNRLARFGSDHANYAFFITSLRPARKEEKIRAFAGASQGSGPCLITAAVMMKVRAGKLEQRPKFIEEDISPIPGPTARTDLAGLCDGAALALVQSSFLARSRPRPSAAIRSSRASLPSAVPWV